MSTINVIGHLLNIYITLFSTLLSLDTLDNLLFSYKLFNTSFLCYVEMFKYKHLLHNLPKFCKQLQNKIISIFYNKTIIKNICYL